MSNSGLDINIKFKQLLKFTLPAICTMLFMSIYIMSDGIIVSAFLGTDSFSSVNIIYPIINIFVAIGTMFGTGLTAIVSRNIARNETDKAREIFSFVITFAILFGIATSIGLFIFIEPIIYMLGGDASLYPLCYEYGSLMLIFLPLIILQAMFQSLFPANGKPLMVLIPTLIGGVLNIVLDLLFVGVFDMGLMGAGFATGIGYTIPAVFGLIYFFAKRNGSLFLVFPKPNFKSLLQSATNGSSEMITNLALAITSLMFNNIMMAELGSNGVASISAILYIDFLLVAICVGYSVGIAPIIAFNYGREDKFKQHAIIRSSIIFNVLIGSILAIVSIIFAKPLCSLFANNNEQVLEIATTGMRLYALCYFFKGINIFITATFTAYSNGKVSALLSFIRTLILIVVFTLLLYKFIGIYGIFIATPLAELCSIFIGLLFVNRYKNIYGYGNLLSKTFKTQPQD